MLRLVKNNLRFHTFNKFFLIAAAMLFFLGMKAKSNDMGPLITEPLSYGIPIVCAVVILNTSGEMSSGGYRNKIAAGYKLPQVYFSMIISSVICAAALFLIIAVPAYSSLGTPDGLLTVLMIYVLSSVVSASLTVLLDSHVIAAAAVLFTGIMFVIFTSPVQDALDVDKYEYRTVFNAAKANEVGIREATTVERSPNPDYPDGLYRAALKTMAYTNPYSQLEYTKMILTQIDFPLGNNQDKEYTIEYIVTQEFWSFPLISAGFSGAVCAVGYCFFRKKDLR